MQFSTILMDPPWTESGGGKCKRGADRHYDLVKTKAIFQLIAMAPVWRPATNAHLYIWATNNYIEDGIWLMNNLGFRYVTNVAWKKDRFGLGQYFRGQHELMLFGVRGKGFDVRTGRRNLPSVIDAPVTRHSEKPVESYELIEARSKGPYLEMFARRGRPGWTAWGDQAPVESEPMDTKASRTGMVYEPGVGMVEVSV